MKISDLKQLKVKMEQVPSLSKEKGITAKEGKEAVSSISSIFLCV